jgi:glyoxylase-like metal-dependent hydrolase (beta-lactamase superfamily II)
MRKRQLHRALIAEFVAIFLGATFATVGQAEDLTNRCHFDRASINRVTIDADNGSHLAIYAGVSGKVETLLLPHGRRDLVSSSLALINGDVELIAPEAEAFALKEPAAYWAAFPTAQFHDYSQQSTKILAAPVNVDKWVKDGDEFSWHDIQFRVIATPGYTRGSVTYLTTVDGQRLAFTGDLIYGDGKLLDLYSFQDAIPSAQIRGYHGYAARLADLVASLNKVKASKPDLLVPARGPVIHNPGEAIDKLVSRVQALYKNYLSTNALHWYFKEDRMRHCGERVLGSGADVELMPYSQHETTPNWIFESSTSRLLVSTTGHGFLLDCGNQSVIKAIQDLIDKGIVKAVDGIFVTHYHDDHTDSVQAAAEHFKCPVYATPEYADVLERPAAYHLPAMTANPIRNVQELPNGHQMKWKEFDLTFHFFPGQTYYHGAVFVEKPNERPVFFIGDAFAPSGFDDYCLLNRNLVREDSGYLLCLKKLRQIDQPFWLVNEHIRHVFSFSETELDYLEDRYRKRIEILRELSPWDDPNYLIDEQWAVCYPRRLGVRTGDAVTVEVRLTNHSPVERTFTVKPRVPSNVKLLAPPASVTIPAGQTGSAYLILELNATRGHELVSVDITSDGMAFDSWAEVLLQVRE